MILVRASEDACRGEGSGRTISDETLSKNEHILKTGDFRAVYKKGVSFRRNGFVLSVARNKLGRNRLGFSIGSANVKLASVRNRIRRLFREIYRKNRSIFATSFDMVLIVRKNPGKKFSYEEARSIFFALLKDAGILQ